MDEIKKLECFNWANAYIDYLTFKYNGLKEKAKQSLKIFLQDFQKQTLDSRRDFIDTVCEIVFYNNQFNLFLPYNLYNEVFKPELKNWIENDPNNPVPLKWSYELDLIKRSVTIDPQDEIALKMLADITINKISMNQHELAYGLSYSGDPINDVELIDFTINKIGNIQDPVTRKRFIELLNELRRVAVECI